MKVMVSTLVAVSGLLTACSATVQESPEPRDSATPHACRSEAAAALVRSAAPNDIELRQRTGAELIRRIAPGDPVTHDFRENRLTIAIDPDRKVVQATCG